MPKSRKSRSRKSKDSRSRSRKSRKAGPYAVFVKANFHKFYKPGGKSPKAAFKAASKQLAIAYRRSR